MNSYKPRINNLKLRFTTLILMILTFVLLIIIILILWPQIISESQSWFSQFSLELRLLVLVSAGGVLGGALNASSLFIESIKYNRLLRSVFFSALIKVFFALISTLIFYILIREGLLTSTANGTDINPLGILVLSILIGIFSSRAVEKLRDISSALFGDKLELEKHLNRVEDSLGISLLDNYKGFLCYSVESESKGIVSNKSNEFQVNKNEKNLLVLWFQPSESDFDNCEEINIVSGIDVNTVTFHLLLHGENIKIQQKQELLSFDVFGYSSKLKFPFQISEDADSLQREIWVEIIQKNRLIQMLHISFKTLDSSSF